MKGEIIISFLDFHKKINHLQSCNDNYRKNYINNTKNAINQKFSQSPYYQIVIIENEKIEARVVSNKEYTASKGYETKKILFKSDYITNKGNYVEINNQQTQEQEIWLIMFFEKDIMQPKAYIEKCNKKIKCNNVEYPCVITSNISLTTNVEENKNLVLPKNYLQCYVKATKDTLNIVENDRFIIDNNAYEVQNIDTISNVENEIGIVEMNLKKVPISNDEKNEIQNNNQNNNHNDSNDNINDNLDESIKNNIDDRW